MSSAVLRIVDQPTQGGTRRILVWLDRPRFTPRRASREFTWEPAPDDAELIRWYLEDYVEFPTDPAPLLASRAETRLADLGTGLFAKVFGGGDAAELWTLARSGPGGLADVRVEVDADPADVPGIPWELLRDPGTGTAAALAAGEFVRTHLEAARQAELPEPAGDRLRVLLVICRPGGRDDVPFRSVASRLIRGGMQQVERLDLDVLRPATFARLAEVLRAAATAGRPYHVVHFDGHGAYLDASALTQDEDEPGDGPGVPMSPLLYGASLAGPVRAGQHGYLLFEDPRTASNQQLVDGPAIGALLVETGVPVLLLNACRSAYAEAPAAPVTGAPATDATDATDEGGGAGTGDVHGRVRAWGSLAAELADAGVPGVVAMRYNVYVVTAAQFVADLYAHLMAGQTLGHAATAARKALADDPNRQVGASPVALQDWTVPTVYEASPLRLLAAERDAPVIRVDLGGGPDRPAEGLPRPPDAGFFGRDETLLALDRAFDNHRVVLLHAFAGAGKTSTAAEFARWYRVTGGLDGAQAGPGPLLWTSFEYRMPLNRVVDAVGTAFAEPLAAAGVQWAALPDDETRRRVAIQVLAQVPVLWVWDNVEPVTGFPAGTRSAWTDQEQRELADFLRELADATKCRVLLTSRRDERGWLGDLPARVRLPAMPMRERLQLALSLAARHDQAAALSEVDWRPLLRYTGGNPLTITVSVGQALREHVATTADVRRFVDRVQSGEVPLQADDDAFLGRDRSLTASLSYGFREAFTEHERAQLAVLHLFRDVVDVEMLRLMGDPKIVGGDVVPVLARLTDEAITALLDRAAEIGILTFIGDGDYIIHPALPWYFSSIFDQHHRTGRGTAERAYVRTLSAFGHRGNNAVGDGYAAEAISHLAIQESNLLHALALARGHQLPDAAVGCLQGLFNLYDQTGRSTEWHRLITEVVPDYIDAVTGQPLAGRDKDYSLIMEFQFRIAWARRDWPAAERMQTAHLEWCRLRAGAALDKPPDQLTSGDRQRLQELGGSEQWLGIVYEEQGDPRCLAHLQAAFDLAEKIGEHGMAAKTAGSIGIAYMRLPELRDLDQAEAWYRRGLELKPVVDRVGRAFSHVKLADIAAERLSHARRSGADSATQMGFFRAAVDSYGTALDLTPANQHDLRSTVQHQLGVLAGMVGDLSAALRHFQHALRHDEIRENTFGAGIARLNIGLTLLHSQRRADALDYARAALANLRAVGFGAAAHAESAERLIAEIEGGGAS